MCLENPLLLQQKQIGEMAEKGRHTYFSPDDVDMTQSVLQPLTPVQDWKRRKSYEHYQEEEKQWNDVVIVKHKVDERRCSTDTVDESLASCPVDKFRLVVHLPARFSYAEIEKFFQSYGNVSNIWSSINFTGSHQTVQITFDNDKSASQYIASGALFYVSVFFPFEIYLKYSDSTD